MKTHSLQWSNCLCTLRVFPISVRQSFACLTACQLIKKELLRHSQDNAGVTFSQTDQKSHEVIFPKSGGDVSISNEVNVSLFNTQVQSYQDKDSHYKNKAGSRPSCPYNASLDSLIVIMGVPILIRLRLLLKMVVRPYYLYFGSPYRVRLCIHIEMVLQAEW